jgi:GNAT superfamily N-acetyltransferase
LCDGPVRNQDGNPEKGVDTLNEQLKTLVPFHELSESQLADVVAIYEESFAAPWEWPSARLYELAGTPDGDVSALAALDRDSVAGLVISEYLPGGRLWHIHYFAVRQDLRSMGWGARILAEVAPQGEDEARRHGHEASIGVALEVEAVDGPPEDADREQRVRRHAFYERNGAIFVVRYPRPSSALPEMPDYDLLLIPESGWNGRLDDALRYRMIQAVAVEGYDTPEDAPWLVEGLKQYVPGSGAAGVEQKGI